LIPESFTLRTRPRRSLFTTRRTTASAQPFPSPTLERSGEWTGEWSVKGSTLSSPSGATYELIRHGIAKDVATRIARRSIVVFGDFPSLDDITGDQKRILDATSQISPRGELFTVYASEYRIDTETVLLLDYLR